MNQRVLAKFTLLLLLSLVIPVSLANYHDIEEKQTKNILSTNDELPILSPELKSQIEETLQGFMGGFMENKGQKNEVIHYYTESAQLAVGFGVSELHFNIPHPNPVRLKHIEPLEEQSGENRRTYTSITLNFLGCNQVSPVAYEPTGVYCNYFIGSNPTEWSINSQYYTKLIYHNLYEQIDLVYELKQGQLKYEFFVHPGGRLEDIKLQWNGPVSLELLEKGIQVDIHRDNRLTYAFTSDFSFVDTSPIIYQSLTRDRPLAGSFEFLDPTTYRFSVPTYDPTKVLIIDPIFLTYSTYVGGSDNDDGNGIALDAEKNVYITGDTYSTDFPTVNAYNDTHSGNCDVFVCKLSADGSSLLYSTYVGGNDTDWVYGIAVDAAGNAYVTGETHSPDFPTVNAYMSDDGGTDAFVCKLSANGSSLLYSTYVGGSNQESGRNIALDATGNAYVTGVTLSTDFPTVNAYDATGDGNTSYYDAFVFKLAANGSTLLYSTYVSGSDHEGGEEIAIDATGNAYVAGLTTSTDFPTVNAYNDIHSGNWDVFVCKLSADGSSLLYSTYVGGSDHEVSDGIAIDAAGNAYVTGHTESTDFPTVNAYNATGDGSTIYWDVFVCKLAANGSSLLYSTYISGTSDDHGSGIAVDTAGNAYVMGHTRSTDFPTVNAYDNTSDGMMGVDDVFVCKLAANGSTLLYSTYVSGSNYDQGGGIALYGANNVYIIGDTSSTDFPTQNAYDTTHNGGYDVFVTKLVLDEFFPVISLVGSTNNSFQQSSMIIDLNVTDDSGVSHVLYNWDGGANMTLPAPYDVTLPAVEWSHVLRVYASDSVRNWASKRFVFVTDDTAPLITLLSPANGSTHPSGTVISVIIEDTSPLSQILYHWDASPNVTLTDSLITGVLPAGDGPHVLHVYAQDQAGNWGSKIWVFTTDDTSLSPSSSTPVISPSFEVVGLFLALTVLVIAPILCKRRRKS